MAILSPIFSDGAVFAANRPIRVFGEGMGRVAIDFLGMHREIEATEDRWCVEFDPRPYGGPYEMTVTLDGNTSVLRDLWMGEVLICSGQSNMGFRMIESKDYPELCEPCPSLRIFHAERVDKNGIFKPADGWKHCDTDEVIKNITAIGYETGLLLAKRTGYAIGLISAAQGASVIQSWMPEGALEKIGLHFTDEELYHSHFTHPLFNPSGCLYNTMFHPWIDYTVSGVIWYQGESNISPAESAKYKQMLAEMIRIWREDLRDPALPFTVIQIADYDKYLNEPQAYASWKAVQAAQLQIQDEVEDVVTVISADVCESDNIHPPTKKHVSARVADAIRFEK